MNHWALHFQLLDTLKNIHPEWYEAPAIGTMCGDLFKRIDHLDCDAEHTRCAESMDKFIMCVHLDRDRSIAMAVRGAKQKPFRSRAMRRLIELKAKEAADFLIEEVFRYRDRESLRLETLATLETIDPAWRATPTAKRHIETAVEAAAKAASPEDKWIFARLFADLRPSEAVQVLAGYLDTRNGFLRSQAITALTRIGDRSVVPLFIERMEKEKDTRVEYMYALGEMKDGRAVKPILRVLAEADTRRRFPPLLVEESCAIEVLGELKAPEAFKPLVKLLKLPEIRNGHEQRRIVHALAKIGDRRVVPELVAILKQGAADDVRYESIKALVDFDDPRSFDVLVDLFDSVTPREKALVIWGLAKLKDRRALPLMKNAVNDRDRTVRAYAEWAVFNLSD